MKAKKNDDTKRTDYPELDTLVVQVRAHVYEMSLPREQRQADVTMLVNVQGKRIA